MRLIDADNMDFTELTDRLCTIGMTGDLTDNGAEELLKEFIDSQPTAYDAEKVIAELEESKKKNFELYENAEYTIEIIAYGNVVNAYGDAIAKVRNG